MNNGNLRILIGIMMIAASFILLSLLFEYSITSWGRSALSGRNTVRSMITTTLGWNYSNEFDEVGGTVKEVKWNEVELDTGGEEVEMHGPLWFWQVIGIRAGDTVGAKGVFVWMMEHGEGWHKEFIPFELTINGIKYGEAGREKPVWMQV